MQLNLLVGTFAAVLIAFLSFPIRQTEAAEVCGLSSPPSLLSTSATEFNICVFGSNNTLISDALTVLGNPLLVYLQQLNVAGCYCRQDCNPSQIVCKDNLLGLTNGVAQLLYETGNYIIYCYCPEYITAGQNPCPVPVNPQPCNPV